MAGLKTVPNDGSVEAFLDGVADDRKRRDSYTVLSLMREATGAEPQMWGDSIVGFGSYHFKYKSGREGDWFQVGFSPRKQSLTLYLVSGFDQYDALLSKLGKYKTGKSCLYITKIEDIDLATLQELIERSVQYAARSDSREENSA